MVDSSTVDVMRVDIVSRFLTRETAETFRTGVPLPGVAAPPPNWIRVADQILRSPLGVDGLDEQLAQADPAIEQPTDHGCSSRQWRAGGPGRAGRSTNSPGNRATKIPRLSYRDVEELLGERASRSTTSRRTGGCSGSP
jgi:hypothetical protein